MQAQAQTLLSGRRYGTDCPLHNSYRPKCPFLEGHIANEESKL